MQPGNLESEADRARLAEPQLYFADHADELVVLDEIQRAPGLFEELRGVIDHGRRLGETGGGFLLLGSAAPELLAQSGESLAGRIAFAELGPLDVSEIGPELDQLWVRGGFPESFLAGTAATSLRWRRDSSAPTSNATSRSSGRASQPRRCGASGRCSPKVYVRDSGLVHALLGLTDKEALLGHPVVGGSWEGMVIENLIGVAGDTADTSFYRTSGGAEIDLVLSWPDGEEWAIEVKRTLSPKLQRGMRSAISIPGVPSSSIPARSGFG